ncbi:MAG TPA: AAA family ATPase [Ktedonobacterales bacterium]|nr:AAA family ATPase [Ktedonobacterales bacterium]
MWRGRHASDGHARTATAERPRSLSTVDELRRHADWERLTDAERSALRSDFAPLPASAATGEALAAMDVNTTIQQWVASLVAPNFQAEAAQVIHSWLSDASPDAHLYIGGAAGQGRHSLAATLARQALAQQPPLPDYCYVPEPGAMDRALLLAIDNGTGVAFTKAIDTALRQLTSGWSGDSDNDSDDANASASAPAAALAAASLTRAQLIAHVFAPLQASTFASARAYVDRLRAAFDALVSDPADLPVTYNDMPTWLVSAASGGVANTSKATSAPVVLGTLVRDKLDDLLIRANGGVLILSASDLLAVDGAWLSLSVALNSRTLQMKPSWPPLPLTARVVLIGDNDAYNALANAAGDFTRIFRYETWCNTSATWNQRGEASYAAIADGAAQAYSLPAFDPSAVARLVEEGARRVGGLNRSYLITDLLLLRDLAMEAGRAARARGGATTTGADVVTALTHRRRLQGATAKRVREAILSGQANTPTAGSAIGQINGLGIYEFHPSEGDFAVPTRISATVSPGRDERLLDIEREAEQADADHVRGEMTIEGYLAHRYGQERAIRLVARVRFEQEHGTTGGDSASGALLYALLSALARVPLRYSYAVTGAVGQYGELQPIGGVNTKIEGFWELCRMRRAQGEQAENGYGVIIPAVNARDLMLREDVAEAIEKEGWFHIWPVSTVDEAMSILTGMPIAEIHSRVEQRLQQFHDNGAHAGNARR